jgi:hypothetical protein
MAHLGPRAFDSIGGEVVSTTAFVLDNAPNRELKGDFLRLIDGSSEAEKDRMIREAIRNRDCGWYHRAASADFQKIPGSPLAYWVPNGLIATFEKTPTFETYFEPREGLTTGNNESHVRYWHEVGLSNIAIGCQNRTAAKESNRRWFPYNKGGELRKWAGNDSFVVNWFDDGKELQNTLHPSGQRIWAHNFNLDFIFRPFISWSDITTKGLSVRQFPSGYLFDATGLSAFRRGNEGKEEIALAICNSPVGTYLSRIINPTLHFKSGDFARLPFVNKDDPEIILRSRHAVELAKTDWNIFETSLRFNQSPLLHDSEDARLLCARYSDVRASWQGMVDEMFSMEASNNRIFIEAYGLQDELSPDVPLSEITLTCNPHYRYGGDKSEQELEDLLRADTMREFISYAVGCMFGRYSLAKPGLIVANQGESLEDYLRQVPEPRFTPDADNVIPLLDGDWFPDDITGRFREFLRVTFGDEHYDENLRFIETALGKKGKPLPIRDFFLKEFYTDHVKRYKKRPIYWLFSSPKGSFNALIYLHRYRPDTASIVLQYLRDFRSKLVSERDHQTQVSISTSASQGEKTKALKQIEELKKILVELDDYERDTLYPLATHQVELDLDDGVKVNYAKLGAALKKIPGLDAKDED